MQKTTSLDFFEKVHCVVSAPFISMGENPLKK